MIQLNMTKAFTVRCVHRFDLAIFVRVLLFDLQDEFVRVLLFDLQDEFVRVLLFDLQDEFVRVLLFDLQDEFVRVLLFDLQDEFEENHEDSNNCYSGIRNDWLKCM